MDLNRRQLLRGDVGGNNLPKRPPWALPEALFTEHCSRCDDCIRACEIDLLFRGSGGFPEIRFEEQGCDFCGDCLESCTTGALQAPVPAPSLAWKWKAVIDPGCLSMRGIVCRACGDACDVDAITFKLKVGGKADPEVDTESCNGCGECLALCPEQMISLEVPPTLD